ncbi:hypothetical protein BGZ60DRAFT_526164 [Tricladium varicosporioides]|nr:hypothetical protein BGZ60DRAFT_526164 [Hymenoscyphus varicosporioides]
MDIARTKPRSFGQTTSRPIAPLSIRDELIKFIGNDDIHLKEVVTKGWNPAYAQLILQRYKSREQQLKGFRCHVGEVYLRNDRAAYYRSFKEQGISRDELSCLMEIWDEENKGNEKYLNVDISMFLISNGLRKLMVGFEYCERHSRCESEVKVEDRGGNSVEEDRQDKLPPEHTVFTSAGFVEYDNPQPPPPVMLGIESFDSLVAAVMHGAPITHNHLNSIAEVIPLIASDPEGVGQAAQQSNHNIKNYMGDSHGHSKKEQQYYINNFEEQMDFVGLLKEKGTLPEISATLQRMAITRKNARSLKGDIAHMTSTLKDSSMYGDNVNKVRILLNKALALADKENIAASHGQSLNSLSKELREHDRDFLQLVGTKRLMRDEQEINMAAMLDIPVPVAYLEAISNAMAKEGGSKSSENSKSSQPTTVPQGANGHTTIHASSSKSGGSSSKSQPSMSVESVRCSSAFSPDNSTSAGKSQMHHVNLLVIVDEAVEAMERVPINLAADDDETLSIASDDCYAEEGRNNLPLRNKRKGLIKAVMDKMTQGEKASESLLRR